MKKSTIGLLGIVAIIIGLSFANCKQSEPSAKDLLIDSWTKLYEASDTSFHVNLTFKSDGTFTWEMIDVVPNHTNSGGEFTATDSEFTLTVDPDCDGIGKYAYTIEDDVLTISMTDDDCEARAPAFEGIWEKH